MVRPVPARHPSVRWGRHRIIFSPTSAPGNGGPGWASAAALLIS